MLNHIHQKRQNTLSYPTQAQIRRAIDAVKKSGVRVGGVEIRPDGTIAILPMIGKAADPSKEAYFGEA